MSIIFAPYFNSKQAQLFNTTMFAHIYIQMYMLICFFLFLLFFFAGGRTTEPATGFAQQIQWWSATETPGNYAAKSHSTLHHHKSILSHHSGKCTCGHTNASIYINVNIHMYIYRSIYVSRFVKSVFTDVFQHFTGVSH